MPDRINAQPGQVFTVLEGGGEIGNAFPICTICGVPHRGPCRLLRRHLRHMELQGRSPLTVYERERMITRLGAWLVRKGAAQSCPPGGEITQPDYASGCGRRTRTSPPPCVADATPEMLYQWRESLRVADATVACYMSSVKGFFGWLAAEGIRDDDPSAQIPVPVTPRRLPRPISEPDLMRALETAPDRIRLMLVLMAWAGLRCKEIANLRAEHVRITSDDPVIVVVIGAAKGKRERAVPLSPWVVEQIRDARPPLPKTGYVFPRLDSATAVFYGNQHRPGWGGGRAGPLSPWMVSRLVAEHLHGLGIPATGHQLRHRFLSQAYNVSRDVIGVQELAGHAALSSTQVYVELSGNRGRQIVGDVPVPPKPRILPDSGAS